MSNPIITELARLYPDYTLSAQKVREADKAKDPAEVAKHLESLIAQLREKMRNQLGVTDVPIDRIVPLMSLNVVITGYSTMTDSQLLDGYSKGEAFALGRQAAVQPAHVPQKGLVEMCYEDILQRESDIEGFKHYQDRIDAGGPNNSTLDLVRDIYWSPEAVKLRGIGHI